MCATPIPPPTPTPPASTRPRPPGRPSSASTPGERPRPKSVSAGHPRRSEGSLPLRRAFGDPSLIHPCKLSGTRSKCKDARPLAAALADLRLDRLFVVHPGKARFPLAKKVEALPLADCLREVKKHGGRCRSSRTNGHTQPRCLQRAFRNRDRGSPDQAHESAENRRANSVRLPKRSWVKIS